MRIELRDENRLRIGRVLVDPAQRPTRVVTENRSHRARHDSRSGQGVHDVNATAAREVFLNWDTALDDAGQLRRCVGCGCNDMFREKAFPQVTAFVVVLAFLGAIIGTLGLATNLPVLLAMAGVLVLDVAILVFSRRRLVCYNCRTSYLELPIARYHRPWDRARADRYPAPSAPIHAVESAVVTGTQPQGALPRTAVPARRPTAAVKPKSYFA